MNGGPSHVDTFDPKPMLDKIQRPAARGDRGQLEATQSRAS